MGTLSATETFGRAANSSHFQILGEKRHQREGKRKKMASNYFSFTTFLQFWNSDCVCVKRIHLEKLWSLQLVKRKSNCRACVIAQWPLRSIIVNRSFPLVSLTEKSEDSHSKAPGAIDRDHLNE